MIWDIVILVSSLVGIGLLLYQLSLYDWDIEQMLFGKETDNE